MKTQVKKIDGSTMEINIEVAGDVVKDKFEEVFKKITESAKVPGFRPGHAPRDMIEKSYSAHAHEQVLQELVPDIYNKAIESEKFDVVDLPQISDVKLDRESLSFKAKVEISPEIKLGHYKKLKVGFKPVTVSSDDIKRFVDSIKEARKLEAADDNLARSLGYISIQEFEKALERQLFIQKENAERQRMENGLIEHITKELDFKVPQSLVNRQVQEMLKAAKLDLALKGVPREKIEEEVKALLTEIEPEAKKQVKIYLVLSEIAKKENIKIDDFMPRRVVELLLREADWS